jgi:hypothetical protein
LIELFCHPRVTLLSTLFTPVGFLATDSEFQHLAPTVRATTKPPAMAPKRANPKADEAAKAALLAARKGKALALTQSTHQEPTEDNVPRTCEDDTFRPAGPKDNRSRPQASPHWKARISPKTARSSASQQKNSYSCTPCASRTAISRGRKRYWRPSASVCPH